MINTAQDTMPFGQLADMTTKLDALGVTNYQTLTLPGYLHSFGYWSSVKDQAIAFLAAWFSGDPPPPRFFTTSIFFELHNRQESNSNPSKSFT